MKIIFKLIKWSFEIGFFLLAGFIMLYAAYYWGWPMLPQGTAFGNDMASAMNNLVYLKQWYPPVPGWIHLWSGGMPFLQLYPILPFITTFFIHLWSGFAILKTMKLVMFFSLPLAALGVAVLGRILTKNWIIGIIAGVIMLLQPDSWLWITVGGFFAVAFSVPVFVWNLVFYCLAMNNKNLWLTVLSSIIYGVTWLAHPMAGMLATTTMAILGLGYGVKLYGWRGSWRGVLKTTIIGILGISLFAWWIFPFFTRSDFGGISLGPEQMYKVTLRELLGLDLPVDIVYITSTFYATFAVILFVLGSVLAFFRRSILAWAVLACGMALFIMTAPYYALPIVTKFVIFWTSTNVRSGLILRILGSIIAAYGAASLVRPFFWLIEKVIKSLKDKTLWFYFTEAVGGVVAIIVVYYLILYGPKIIPPFQGEGNKLLAYSGYGPFRNWFAITEDKGVALAIIPQEGKPHSEPLFKKPEEILRELPQIITYTNAEEHAYMDEEVKQMVRVSGVTDKDRIDTMMRGGMVIGMLNNFSGVSQIQGYVGTSLIQRMIGWQVDCTFYNKLCGPDQVADIYRWFGISQIWTGDSAYTVMKNFDRPDLFEVGEKPLGEYDGRPATLQYFAFKDDPGLASITNKPSLLIIGDNPPNFDVLDIIFRDLSKVDFGYKDAWSVKGKRFIDDYSLEELQRFEVVILHGYQYHNKTKAWNLLEKYVNAGGNLFVDTGWQYVAEDWGKENQGVIEELMMPKIIPVEKTKWGKIEEGKWDLKLGNNSITEGLTLEDWGEPIWSGQPWGVAAAKKESLKQGAISLLENNGQILSAAWEVGRGKVFWTGFDYWGHLMQYQANNERQLVNNVLQWLVVGEPSEEVRLDFNRQTPDKVTIDFKALSGKNKLMFKEVASDNWKAELITPNSQSQSQSQSITMYKAGPGWKMVLIPDDVDSGQIVFSFVRNQKGWIGLILSYFAIMLVFMLFLLKLVKRDWEQRIIDHLKNFWQSKKANLKTNWQKEEE